MLGRGGSLNGIVLFTCAATLLLSAAAVGFAARALFAAKAIGADLERLARSLDSAMRDLSARSHRDTATIEELNATVSRELELLAARPPARHRPPEAPAAAARDNIVALPAARRSRPDRGDGAAAARPADIAGFETALQRAYASGHPELSLQPIVSITQGAATGFEVYVHLTRDDGQAISIQRLQSSMPGLSPAAFERWLVAGVIDDAERRFGDGSDGMPMHVQISDALLGDSDALAAVLEAYRAAPAARRIVVLSLPSAILERGARHAEAIDMLSDTGLRLAVEGWSGSRESADRMKRLGVSFLKLSAERLLGRAKLGKGATSPAKLIETAAAQDIPVIAINVADDEDAVSLIDLGVILMTGSRFSGPRRLRPHGEEKQEKIAHV